MAADPFDELPDADVFHELPTVAPKQRGPRALLFSNPFTGEDVDTGLSIPQWLSEPVQQLNRGGMDYWQGVKQKTLQQTDPEAAKKYTRDVTEERKQFDEEHGSSGWRVAGNMFADPLGAVGGGAKTLLGKIAAGGGTGAASGYLNFTPEGESAGKDAAIGGIAGGVGGTLGHALDFALKPVKSKLDPVAENIVKQGESLGFKFLPSQKTGSRSLEGLEQALGEITGRSRLAGIAEHNRQLGNKIVGQEMGEQGVTHLTPDVMEAARKRLGNEYNAIWNGREINADPKFFAAIDKIRLGEDSGLQALKNSKISDIVDELQAGQQFKSPRISGDIYQQTRSKLKSIRQHSIQAGDSDTANSANAIMNALDNAAERSLPPDILNRLDDANKQYRAFSVAKKAINPDGGGDIAPGRLKNAVYAGWRNANYGNLDKDDVLKTLSNIYSQTKPLINDSGTPARTLWQNRIQNPMSMLPVAGAGAGGVFGGIPGAALGGAAGYAFPRLADAFLHSELGHRYLTDGLLPNFRPFASGLLQRSGIGLDALTQQNQ